MTIDLMTLELKTERLLGRPMGPADQDDLLRLHNDSRVMATLSVDGKLLSEQESSEMLSRCQLHWQENKYGLYAFREKLNGRFVGYSGMKRTNLGDKEEIEFLHAVLSEDWDKGYATEMGIGVLGWGLQVVGINDLVCFTLPHNQAAHKVMEKLGFRQERKITHAGVPHLLYRMHVAKAPVKEPAK